MVAYYNEFKPEAAHMLRQLIKDELIAPGDVDDRSIIEVKPDDLKNYTQCHFFAGIGGWSVALRMAAWGDDMPVWTGSCPCQPFSTAGNQKGKKDERHLWPIWFKLISQCQPSAIFGEQVAAAIARGWWDDVANDLERENYACGAAVLPACSVGQPHKRDRLWFMANSNSRRFNTQSLDREYSKEYNSESCGLMGNSELYGFPPKKIAGELGSNAHESEERSQFTQQSEGASPPRDVSEHVANSQQQRRQGRLSGREDSQRENQHGYIGRSSTGSLDWVNCPDGKSRPVEPGICLLANGVQHRASLLHAFGNAIVPQVAAEFIKSCTN